MAAITRRLRTTPPTPTMMLLHAFVFTLTVLTARVMCESPGAASAGQVPNPLNPGQKDQAAVGEDKSENLIIKTIVPSSTTAEEALADKFYVKDADNEICLLATFAAVFKVKYVNTEGEKALAVITLPWNVTWQKEGTCGEDMTSLQVSWDDDAFGFNMDFEKDECSSHMNAAKSEKGCWFMSSVMFKYNSSDESIFTNAKNAGHQVAYNNNSKMFETPQGYSSLCNKGTSLPLTGDDGTTSTTLSLSAVQLQPFGVKLGEFSKGYLCLEAMSPRNVRNQKVAIATGSVLAVVALLVIVGYYIRRTYFDRIKYQTMQ